MNAAGPVHRTDWIARARTGLQGPVVPTFTRIGPQCSALPHALGSCPVAPFHLCPSMHVGFGIWDPTLPLAGPAWWYQAPGPTLPTPKPVCWDWASCCCHLLLHARLRLWGSAPLLPRPICWDQAPEPCRPHTTSAWPYVLGLGLILPPPCPLCQDQAPCLSAHLI